MDNNVLDKVCQSQRMQWFGCQSCYIGVGDFGLFELSLLLLLL